MDFGLSEEQELLRAEVERFLVERAPLSRVRQIMAGGPDARATLWQELAELGWTGLLIPEAYGGAGLGFIDAAVVLEATGRHLLPAPLLSTLLASLAICRVGSPAQRERWLPGLATGSKVATIALCERGHALDADRVGLQARRDGNTWRLTGAKEYVHDVADADLFVVLAREADDPEHWLWFLLDADQAGVRARPHPTLDATKQQGTLELDDVRVDADELLVDGAAARSTRRLLLDAGAVGCSAEMLGAASAAHALTVGYAKQRTQFDQPIGRFQGVKHPLAETHVDIETARSLCYFAAWTLDASPEELARAAAMAKAYTTDALVRMGVETIQLHGAIGYTAEYDAQLYFKRSKWARPAFGDATHHYERVARLLEL